MHRTRAIATRALAIGLLSAARPALAQSSQKVLALPAWEVGAHADVSTPIRRFGVTTARNINRFLGAEAFVDRAKLGFVWSGVNARLGISRGASWRDPADAYQFFLALGVGLNGSTGHVGRVAGLGGQVWIGPTALRLDVQSLTGPENDSATVRLALGLSIGFGGPVSRPANPRRP